MEILSRFADFFTRSVQEQDFLSRHLEPNHRLVVIGPGDFFMDPSTLHCASIVNGEKGRIVLVDPQVMSSRALQSRSLLESNRNHLEALKTQAGGFGDLEHYLENFKKFRQTHFGFALKTPKPVPGLAHKTGLESNSQDAYLNRGVFEYSLKKVPREKVLQTVQKTVAEAIRVLARNGHGFFLFPGKQIHYRDWVRKELSHQGIRNVRDVRVRSSSYHIDGRYFEPSYPTKHILYFRKGH
jgi:hypothetical protein